MWPVPAVITGVFATTESWQDYAVSSLQTVERLAGELGLAKRLHLWPDKSLGNPAIAGRMPSPAKYLRWLTQCWGRVSEWPQEYATTGSVTPANA
jgi:hypothetical protein